MKILNISLLIPAILLSPFALGYDSDVLRNDPADNNQKTDDISSNTHASECVLHALGGKTHRNRHLDNRCDNSEQVGGDMDRGNVADKTRRNSLIP